MVGNDSSAIDGACRSRRRCHERKANLAVWQAKFKEVISYRGGTRRGAHLGGSRAAGSIETRRATTGLHARPSAVMQAHGRSPLALSLAQSAAVRCPEIQHGVDEVQNSVEWQCGERKQRLGFGLIFYETSR
jgi:hypothetical protein